MITHLIHESSAAGLSHTEFPTITQTRALAAILNHLELKKQRRQRRQALIQNAKAFLLQTLHRLTHPGFLRNHPSHTSPTPQHA